jgi:hypothetical protein
MNDHVALNLAMILFLPWFAILGVLYWVYPRVPRTAARRLFDAAALLAATLAAVFATWWSIRNADPGAGSLWKQVLASTLSYGAFLGVMTAAFLARRRWILGDGDGDAG